MCGCGHKGCVGGVSCGWSDALCAGNGRPKLLIAGLLGWAWRRRRVASLVEQLAVAAVLAGALGNLLDRLLRGYVVDFVWVRWCSVFNVADVLVVAGAIAMMLAARNAAAPPV